ncbi:transposable element Tc1 transposase [Trichonephila clavipes]|nr:transposable element Tc1 transposase [Trichonephila clavipes]
MPGKRATRHFSQLSEFERVLIIGMQTAGWSMRRVAGQVDRSECAVRNFWEQWTREVPTRGKPGLERPGRPRGERIEGSCGKHLWTSQCLVKRYEQTTDDNRVRVWRRPGERYNSPIVLRHTARTAGVMVWGGIAYDSRSTLIVMRGTLTGERYVDDIPRPHVRPFLNDSSWPACSPDSSPAEHVWYQLKRQMPSCHSIHDLELAVQDLWGHLPQDNIRCLIKSMPDRVAACIAAGGGPTSY